jgi:hypothetical protein
LQGETTAKLTIVDAQTITLECRIDPTFYNAPELTIVSRIAAIEQDQVYKEDAEVINLPSEAISEDRGASHCEIPQLVIASREDAAYWKNDRTSFAFLFDSISVELEKDGHLIAAPGEAINFPYQSNAVGYCIDWRQVHIDGILQQGNWRVKINWVKKGVSGWFWYGCYQLLEYNPFNVRGTVRLFVVLNDVVRKQGINYKDSGFAGTIRFKGEFGNMQPNYDVENIVYTDRTQEKVRIEALRTYELRSSQLLYCMTRLIDEEHLLTANQIFITDHNANNHRQDFFDFPVILSQEESLKIEYTGTVWAKITALFIEKTLVSESKYDGNIKGSQNIILSLPSVVNVPGQFGSATANLVNSIDTLLSTTTIAAGAFADILAEDENIVVVDEDDNELQNVFNPAQEDIEIEVDVYCEPQGTNVLSVTQTDFGSSTVYYGGLQTTLAWQINKWDLATNTKTIATEINNPTYTSLADAWNDRLTINYI